MISPVTPPRQKRRSRKLAHELVDAISESIRSCAIRPGDKLPPESMIMAEHGVSRTVAREAITNLQVKGLIETRHGVGSFVRAIPTGLEFHIDANAILTVRDVLAMLELRISLETEAAALAAARRSHEHLEGMSQALIAFRTSLASGGDTVAPDFNFHLQIAYSTGNRYFADIMSHLGTNTIPRTRVDAIQNSTIQQKYLSLVNDEHTSIYEAIMRRDPEGSRAAMRAHLTSSRERLRRAHDFASTATPALGQA
jgi:GntR family transcriptional regulator, transcriptional repressor for pyruvate dehydrogenase complex